VIVGPVHRKCPGVVVVAVDENRRALQAGHRKSQQRFSLGDTPAIEAWRDGLPERQRKRLAHPLSVTQRFKASMAHGNGKCPQDLRRDAAAAWRRFVSCVRLLPPDQAMPLWQAVQAQVPLEFPAADYFADDLQQ
jgi:hypothetical protein